MKSKKIKVKKCSKSKVSAKKVKVKIKTSYAYELRTRKRKQKFLMFPALGKLALRTSAILLLVCLNWAGLSGLGTTIAYLQDTESSIGNSFIAGTLDFILTSPSGFDPSTMEIGGSATRTISLINYGNDHKYKVSAINFSGLLCEYLDLTAFVDATGTIYSGNLMDFVEFGPQEFSHPDDWNFTLTLASSTPEELIGETCNFDFTFFGSQIRHNLPFGMGFNDIEQENNNVKATICYDAETRTMGYWKTHPNVYKSYLPQYLGCNTTSSECVSGYEEINNKTEVDQIFDANNSVMRNKLKKQLLAMKFNIAHFKIGDYIPGTSTESLNQVVANADDLLQQNPEPSSEILEAMKNLLDGLNQDTQFTHCSGSFVRVIIPNGGEIWWVGRTYDLTWTTHNLVCSNDSLASIWYSNDSGVTWGNIATSIENDGVYSWRIPLYLENGTYYVPSEHARIKIVTQCSENLLTNGWDMSDNDFCPPIDYGLLLPEEIEALKAMGLLPEDFIEVPENPELIVEETSTTSEEISTTSEEFSTTSEEFSTTSEEIYEESTSSTPIELPPIPDSPTGTSTENSEETLPDENAASSEPLIEEVTEENNIPDETNPEEKPVEEIPVPEETLIIQETPITDPEQTVIPDSVSAENGDGGTNDGGVTEDAGGIIIE